MGVENPLISVVVPVYKAETWLDECIKSLTSQTVSDYEVILVDDGSPDRSGELCDAYARRDGRLRVFHQANGGVTSARRAGVQAARGAWIAFVDADDYVASDYLERLYSRTALDVDIVCANYGSEKRLSGLAYVSALLRSELPLGLPGKLFRRALFDAVRNDVPRSVTNGEDHILNVRLALALERFVSCCRSVGYFYRPVATSATHAFRDSMAYRALVYRHMLESFSPAALDVYLKDLVYMRWLGLAWMAAFGNGEVDFDSPYVAELRADLARVEARGERPLSWVARWFLRSGRRPMVQLLSGLQMRLMFLPKRVRNHVSRLLVRLRK